MNNFEYWSPTKVLFGKGMAAKVGSEVKEFGGRRVLIIYGGGSVVKSGLLDEVKKSLEEQSIDYFCVGGVQPNPLAEFAQEIADDYKSKDIDFVLGVGGGSAIDTAKAVAHGIANPDYQIWDMFTLKQPITKSLPVGVVLTLAAAGSETSNSSVLTSVAAGIKRGVVTQLNRPKFAVMDPVLTYSTPKRHTACGIIDIFMHTLDRYFAPDADNELTDVIAEGLMRVVIINGRRVLENPQSYKARSELLWAGSLAHNGLTGLGQAMDFSAHQLGAPISAKYDTPHGETLAIMWPAWAKYVYRTDISRFAKYARFVWGSIEHDDEKAAIEGIEATKNFFSEIGSPVSLTQAIGSEAAGVLDELTDICTFRGTRTIGVFKELDADDIRAIYELAL